MGARPGGSSSAPSLPPPCPKSPPAYPDLYGKRRETAKVQMLEREIGFLEEELKTVDGLQPASRSCKEVADFILANSDPLILRNRKNRRSCRFWKWLCGMPCFSLSWICCRCCSGCSLNLEMPRCCCCDCDPCSCLSCACFSCACFSCSCFSCPTPKWRCCSCSCPKSHCCKKISCCSRNCCCVCQFPSCPDCSCCKWKCSCSYPKCPKVCLCFSCTKSCCNPCYLCC